MLKLIQFLPKWRGRQTFSIFLSTIILSGCVTAPDYKREDFTDYFEANYQNISLLGEERLVDEGTHEQANWWQSFDDPLINELIDETLTNNLSLKATSANVLAAEANMRAAVGSRWPNIGISVPASRSFVTSNDESRIYTDNYQTNLTVSWQVDLFGKLKNNQKASAAEFWGTEADREALKHTLVGNVIKQRVQISVAAKRLELAENILASRERSLTSVEYRYQQGVSSVSVVDVRLARENLASAKADIAARRQDLAIAQTSLELLLGRTPGTTSFQNLALQPLPAIETGIIGVPIHLLDQRPDLRSAEFNVIAANARVGASIADLYPDMTLNGSLGFGSDDTEDFFSVSNQLGQITAQLSGTLFQRGRLQANVDAAEAQLEAQANLYANEILTAIKEVEDAIVQNRYLEERISHVEEQVAEVRVAESVSRERYQRGLSTFLAYLESERRLHNAEDLLLQLEQQLWNARVDLHLAIGGDWTSSK